MIFNRSYKIVSFAIALMSVCSCADNLFVEENTRPEEYVNFNIVASDYTMTRGAEALEDDTHNAVRLGEEEGGLWVTTDIEDNTPNLPVTRGTQVTTDNFISRYGEFTVNAFEYSSDWETGKSSATTFISNEVIKVNKLHSSKFWPFNRINVRFYAHAPGTADGASFSFDDEKNLSLSYAVPSNVKNQKDILIATPVDMSSSEPDTVDLRFHHVLTSIRIKAVPSEYLSGTVESVTFKNIVSNGSYKCGNTLWTLGSEVRNFTVKPNINLEYDPNGTNAAVDIVAGDSTFMMIPQTLAENAELEIVVDSDGVEKVLKASMAGQVWPMSLSTGKTVIYTIRSEYDFSLETTPEITDYIEPETTGINYKGGEILIDVNSDKILSDGTTKQAAWVIDNINDIPEWATIVEDHDADTIKITLRRVDPTYATDHHALLLKNPPVSDVYDLSTKGGTTAMNTANCYIVNAPGKYKLPLVYGNAIVDGTDNQSSYKPLVSGNNVMPQVNHLGNQIDSPYIYENDGCTPESATLIWLDTNDGNGQTYEVIEPNNGMIRNVSLDDTKKYLTFEVDQASLRQGNAIVAVLDSEGTIMWSWHIWVTDYEPLGVVLGTGGYEPDRNHDYRLLNYDRIVQNITGEQYTFMPINIGWVYTSDVLYAERSFTIRIKQVVTGKYEDITIVQPGDRVIDGYNPYFQMFRKDPLVSGIIGEWSGNEDQWLKDIYLTDVNYNPTGVPVLKKYWQNHYNFVDKDEFGGYQSSIRRPYRCSRVGDGNLSSSLECYNGNAVYNLWNNYCNQPVENGWDVQKTVKTIYDPTPVGYCVPPVCAYSGFTQDGKHDASSYFGTDYQNSYFLSTRTDPDEHCGYFGYCFPMTNEKYGNLWIKPHYKGVINFPARGEISHGTESLMNIAITTGVCTASLRSKSPTSIANQTHIVFYTDPYGALYSAEYRGRAFSMRAVRYEGDVRYAGE